MLGFFFKSLVNSESLRVKSKSDLKSEVYSSETHKQQIFMDFYMNYILLGLRCCC